jgi:hypothetical protein
MRACNIFFGDNDKNRLDLMSKELGSLSFKIRVDVRGEGILSSRACIKFISEMVAILKATKSTMLDAK